MVRLPVLGCSSRRPGPRSRCGRRCAGTILPGSAQLEERGPHHEVPVAHPLGDGLHPPACLCTALPLLHQRPPPVESIMVLAELFPRCEAKARGVALERDLVEETLQHDVNGRFHLQVAEGVGYALGQIHDSASLSETLLEQEDQLQQQHCLVGGDLIHIHHLLATGPKDFAAHAGHLQLCGILRRDAARHLPHELPQPCFREADGRQAL
mmetsp:Transcript_68736/g.154509  ORF Transcript_68736/g.154509 Transcript_68736/m.154509 type:complete len:210 (+) Transcript_68736:340-969(+)